MNAKECLAPMIVTQRYLEQYGYVSMEHAYENFILGDENAAAFLARMNSPEVLAEIDALANEDN
jgi:hypothetical protein